MLSEPWANRFRGQRAALAQRAQSSSVVRWAVPIRFPGREHRSLHWRACRRLFRRPDEPPPLVCHTSTGPVVGVFGALFTAVFTALTPNLVGSLEVFGALVAVFAAMIWLSFLSQAVLLGAAWVHRRDQERGTANNTG